MLTHPIRVGGDATPGLSRREFLQGAGVLFGTLWASSGALLALAPSRAWALELKTFGANTGKSLLMLTRNIYPHDKLDDAVYALVVKDLDAEAGTTAANRNLEIVNSGAVISCGEVEASTRPIDAWIGFAVEHGHRRMEGRRAVHVDQQQHPRPLVHLLAGAGDLLDARFLQRSHDAGDVGVVPDQLTVAGRRITGCAGCHSSTGALPLDGGTTNFLGGANGGLGPGVLVPPNLTPGGALKDWSDGEIVRDRGLIAQ